MKVFHFVMDATIRVTIFALKVLALCAMAFITVIGIIVSSANK